MAEEPQLTPGPDVAGPDVPDAGAILAGALAAGNPPPETTNAPITGQLQAPEQQNLPQIQQPRIPPPRPPGTSSLGSYTGTKGQIFRNMLGDFLYATGKGLAEAGHGPEANFRGAGAAISAIRDRDIQNQQIAMQQYMAQIQEARQRALENLQLAQARKYAPQVWTDEQGVQHELTAEQYANLKGRQIGAEAKKEIAKGAQETAIKIAGLKEGIRMPVPPEIASQVGVPAGTMLGKSGWANINSKLAAQGKNIQMGDIGEGHVGLVNKATGEVVKDLGVGQYVKRAEASAYFQAKFGVVPIQGTDENGDTYTSYVSKLEAPGKAPAANAFSITQGKAGLNNYKDALNRVSDNLDELKDETQRALIARTLRNVGTIHDPGIIASVVGSELANGLTPKSADLVAAILQAREFIGANRKFAGNFTGSEALYQRMVSNVPGPMLSPEVNRALIKQDLANTARIEKQLTVFQGGAPKDSGGSSKNGEGAKYSSDNPFAPGNK